MAMKLQYSALTRRVLLLGSVALTLSAAAPTWAQELEKVSVRLDWLPGADHAALYLAKERGYYKDGGLDVEILPGQGSTSTIQVVGSGSQTIGLASLSAVATAVSKGVPVIGIAGIMQRAPESIISLQKKGPINGPKDVEGKTMGAEPGDQAQRLFDAFAAKTNIDLSTIKKVNVTKTGALQALLNEDVDFVAAWAVPDGTKANKIKAINKPLMFADYGVNTLSTGIFVTTETAEKKADTLKKFMAATIKAADDVAKDPQAGIDAVKKASADVDPEILKIEINDLPNMLHTDHSKGKPFGWVAQEDLLQTIDILETYFGMAKGLTPDKIYTDRFFPPQN